MHYSSIIHPSAWTTKRLCRRWAGLWTQVKNRASCHSCKPHCAKTTCAGYLLGEATAASRGEAVPTCRTRHAHVAKALQSSFPLLSKLPDVSRKTESLENWRRDFKQFICFILFYCSTSKPAGDITQYDCTGSRHTHIENIYFILSLLH